MQTIDLAARHGAANRPSMNGWIAAGCVLLLMCGTPGLAGAQTPSMQQVAPAAWIRYAQVAGERFQAALADGGDEAQRLQQALIERAGAGAAGDAGVAAAPPSVVVRAWIGRDGAITRVEFDSLDDILAEASLEHLLTVVALPPPPVDMLQPLRVRLQLVPNPDAPSEARTGA